MSSRGGSISSTLRITTIATLVLLVSHILSQPARASGIEQSPMQSFNSVQGAGSAKAITKTSQQREAWRSEELDALGELQKGLAQLGLLPDRSDSLKAETEMVSPQSFSWYGRIPFSDYMLLLRGETGFIRCVGQRAWHINVHLKNYRTNVDIFNVHAGAGRNPTTGRITVFLFDSVNNRFEMCQQIPSVNDLRATIRSFLDSFLNYMGIALPVFVVTAIATLITWAILVIGIPVLVIA